MPEAIELTTVVAHGVIWTHPSGAGDATEQIRTRKSLSPNACGQ